MEALSSPEGPLLLWSFSMRYFTLEDSEHEELDITTKEIFFHEVSGLGFEEDNELRRIGDVWWLDSSALSQTEVSGKVRFTEEGEETPYQKYFRFKNFIAKNPLIISYYPNGIEDQLTRFYKRVRVSTLEKTEYNEYGVLDCSISFIPYTPWYRSFSIDNTKFLPDGDDDTTGWIWGSDTTPALAFEPLSEEVEGVTSYYILDGSGNKVPAIRAKFRFEIPQTITAPVVIENNKNPVKLTIYGPVRNPSWSLRNNNTIIATGGFDGNYTLESNEELIIDNTSGQYIMQKRNQSTNVYIDVYQQRDFDSECFFTLKEGINEISVISQDGDPVRFTVEGHIYHATV
jgi:hypothetical protein